MSRTGKYQKVADRVRKVVRRTLEFFQENPGRWVKGHYDDGESVCLIGGLRRIAHEQGLNVNIGDAVGHMIMWRARNSGAPVRIGVFNLALYADIPNFNDDSHVTINEIYRLLELGEEFVQQDESIEYGLRHSVALRMLSTAEEGK